MAEKVGVEFGFFAQGAVPEPLARTNPDLEHQRIMESVDLAVASEAVGYKYAWASEHHFLTEYSHMSTPDVWSAFVAARTSRLHVGSAIINTTPPVNHPARVAEVVAMLDHLTEGRFEFGTGRGSSTTEMGGFGIDDPDSTRSMWKESITEIVRMWREQEYSHHGEHFSMPARNVLPKPYRKPHPPLWVAAGNPPTFELAARLGLGVLCFTFGAPGKGHLPEAIKVYKETIKHAEPIGDYVNDNIVCVTNMVCAENRHDAFELCTRIGMSYYQSLVVRWLDTFPRPKNIPAWPELLPEPTVEQVEALAPSGAFVAGDPDDCARGVQVYADLGVDQLVFSPLTTQISYEDALASMELFGKEVIGRFDADPQHRTDRMRAAGAG